MHSRAASEYNGLDGSAPRHGHCSSSCIIMLIIIIIHVVCLRSLHVASVVQMMHMIMVHGGLLKRKVFDDLMTMACYLSAAIHDYEHGGVNNDFLIQTRDKLAVTYNDISPLENHHLAAAARLMADPRYRFTDVSR